MKEDFINFMNQKSLLYIEYNIQYSLKFNNKEKENYFIFRIRPIRTNIQDEDYKIEIIYKILSSTIGYFYQDFIFLFIKKFLNRNFFFIIH